MDADTKALCERLRRLQHHHHKGSCDCFWTPTKRVLCPSCDTEDALDKAASLIERHAARIEELERELQQQDEWRTGPAIAEMARLRDQNDELRERIRVLLEARNRIDALLASDEVRELERLAEALVALEMGGPWAVESCGEKGDGAEVIGIVFRADDENCERQLSGRLDSCDEEGNDIDYHRDEVVAVCDHSQRHPAECAEFIIAANPSCVLRLLRELRGGGGA